MEEEWRVTYQLLRRRPRRLLFQVRPTGSLSVIIVRILTSQCLETTMWSEAMRKLTIRVCSPMNLSTPSIERLKISCSGRGKDPSFILPLIYFLASGTPGYPAGRPTAFCGLTICSGVIFSSSQSHRDFVVFSAS